MKNIPPALRIGISVYRYIYIYILCAYLLMSLWKWRVDQSITSAMASYSEYKRQQMSVFGKMGTRHQRLQSFWQKRISQQQDRVSINF